MISKIIRFLPIVVLLLTGCSKFKPEYESDKFPDPPPSLKEFKSISGEKSLSLRYRYQDNLLALVESLGPDPGTLRVYRTTHVIDNKIAEISYSYRSDTASALLPEILFKYEYQRGRLWKQTGINVTTQEIRVTTTYTYDNAGHIKKISTDSRIDSHLLTRVDEFLCDQKGNVISVFHREYRDGRHTGDLRWAYTYDDKINPRQFVNPEGPVVEYFSPSNVTSTIPGSGLTGPGTTTSYVYNAQGYPVSAIHVDSFGAESRLTFTY